jgi:hypothetical protein
METPTTGSTSRSEIGEKTLDAVLSLLHTIRSITSIATPKHHSDAGQTLMVGSAPAETDTKALESDALARIAVLENKLKQERAAKEVALSNLQQVIQLCAPARNEYPYQTSVGFEKVNQIINLQKLLNESKEENEQLKVRFRAATHIKAGELAQKYVELAPAPDTAENSDKDNGSGSPTSNEDLFREQSSKSPLDIECIPKEGATDINIKGAQDHLQELPHDSETIGMTTAPRQLLEDVMDDGFRSLEDVLGGDDEHEVVGF